MRNNVDLHHKHMLKRIDPDHFYDEKLFYFPIIKERSA